MIGATPFGLRILAPVFAALVVGYLLAPLLVALAASVSAGAYLAFPPQGFSLKWYGAILGDARYGEAALTSLWIALAATAGATVMGVAAALALTRHRPPGHALLQLLFLSPLLLPVIVVALGLLITASSVFGRPSLPLIVMAHAVLGMPYVVRTTSAVLSGIDAHAEEAARVMGANWLQRVFLIILPQCRAGILAGALLAFIVSFDDAVVILFLRSPTLETLPLRIYSDLEFNPDPTVAAASSLLILTAAVAVLAVERLLGARNLAA